jgi:hypothetical protein
MKKFGLFAVFVVLVIGFLLSISSTKYSDIPDDADHAGITDAEACMKCHGPDKKDALKDTHPPKYECMKCHKRTKI